MAEPRPTSTARQRRQRQRVLGRSSTDGSSLLCFEKLLVGGSFDAFNSEALNVGKEALLALYRSRVLRWHGIDPGIVPKEHQILLVDKHGEPSTTSARSEWR